MPGSIVIALPARSVSLDSVERRGASWTATPTPCPSPWPKFSPKPASVIGVARELVGLDPGHPRLDVRARALLRLEADVVGLAQPVGQPAGRERARAIAAVAVDADAPVDRDERPAVDDPVRRMRVRVRAVRAGGDDAVERELVGAVGVQQLAQPPRDLALAAPDPRLGGQRLETAVGDAARALKLRDLLVLLDRPQLLDEAARRHEVARALGERLPLCVGQDVGLELHALRQPLGDVAHQRALRQDGLDSLDGARRLDVAKVRVEGRPAVRLDDQRGIRAVEPRQVQDVRQVGDEQRRVETGRQRSQPCAHAATSCPARNSSASR